MLPQFFFFEVSGSGQTLCIVLKDNELCDNNYWTVHRLML